MKRYLSQGQIERVSKDFGFLVEKIRKSYGELDLRLRDGYFNLYYKGNSLAKVTVKKDEYVASIHKKFSTDKVFRGDKRFESLGEQSGNYIAFLLAPDEVHPFFQKKHLDRLCSNIARVGYSEEITFEQMLITDNLDREDFLIIDRQVTETALRRKRMDLLALRKIVDNRFRFIVIEVKLGNNPELRYDVADQLKGYFEHIESHFEEWKASYEETYRQMKRLGLFDLPRHDEIEILPGTQGLVVVGGYSGIAKKSIEELRSRVGDIEVKLFAYNL